MFSQVGNMREKIQGKGFVNKLINNLPFEAHIPTYNFCGAGTKIRERMKRGDVGVNLLDDACKEHDLVYEKYSNNLERRWRADFELMKKSQERVKANDAKKGEKIAAFIIAKLMQFKVKVGWGLKNKMKDK